MKKITILFLLLFSLVWGQSFDGKSLGMAGNFSAISRGVNSIAWNPANIALKRGNTIEINILSFNIALFNSSFSLSDYNRYFTEEGHHGHWTESDKQAILDLIPDDGFNFNTEALTNILGVAYNNFGFTIQAISQGRVELVKKPFDIALNGENFNKNYTYNESSFIKGKGYSAAKFSLAYALPYKLDGTSKIRNYLPHLYRVTFGVNLNYYMGITVAQTLQSNILINRMDNEDEILKYRAHIKARTASPESGISAGRGFGIDIGATAKYTKKWLISLSITNLFASINWDKNTELVSIIEADSAKIDDIRDDNTDATKISEDTTYSTGAFSTRLPTVLRLGASYEILKNLTLTAEYQQGLDEHFNNTYTPRFGIGAEYFALSWLPLRTGLAVGGNDGFLFGLGLGLYSNNFEFDISYGMNRAIWPTKSNGLLTAMSFKLLF